MVELETVGTELESYYRDRIAALEKALEEARGGAFTIHESRTRSALVGYILKVLP